MRKIMIKFYKILLLCFDQCGYPHDFPELATSISNDCLMAKDKGRKSMTCNKIQIERLLKSNEISDNLESERLESLLKTKNGILTALDIQL